LEVIYLLLKEPVNNPDILTHFELIASGMLFIYVLFARKTGHCIRIISTNGRLAFQTARWCIVLSLRN